MGRLLSSYHCTLSGVTSHLPQIITHTSIQEVHAQGVVILSGAWMEQ